MPGPGRRQPRPPPGRPRRRAGQPRTQLDQVGRYQEALDATQEAVTLCRALAADNPAAHQADLAAALNNLGNRLDQVGRYQEALDATQEAVTLRRALAADNPAAHQADLATRWTIGNRLYRVGRYQEALDAAQEAVTLCRALAADNPAPHQADLAIALNNLGVRLYGSAGTGGAGRPQETVTLRRAWPPTTPPGPGRPRPRAGQPRRPAGPGRPVPGGAGRHPGSRHPARALAADNPARAPGRPRHERWATSASGSTGWAVPVEALAARTESVRHLLRAGFERPRTLSRANTGVDSLRSERIRPGGMQYEAIMHDLADPT